MRILFYVISILVPLAGIIIGAVYLSKNDPESKHVGKMCLILGIAIGIILPILLSAALYAMVVGLDQVVDGHTPAVAIISKNPIGSGYKFVFSATTRTVGWNDLTLEVSDGVNFVSWHGLDSDDLTSLDPPATYSETSPRYLGDLDIYLNVIDLSGNGLMSNGDFITLEVPPDQNFDDGTTYTLVLIWEPTGGQMATCEF